MYLSGIAEYGLRVHYNIYMLIIAVILVDAQVKTEFTLKFLSCILGVFLKETALPLYTSIGLYLSEYPMFQQTTEYGNNIGSILVVGVHFTQRALTSSYRYSEN